MSEMKLDPAGWRSVGGLPMSAPRGRILFEKIWGSHSHGTELPTSDVDYTGVYVADSNDYLGLNPPPDTLTGNKPDYQVHELKKFCDLLVKGNFTIIEMLFTDRFCNESAEWKALKERRMSFLSATAVRQYLGYAQAQLSRYRNSRPVNSSGGVPGEKWCYHMLRACWDAERIARGEPPKVWKDGSEHETLMLIRTGQMTTETAVTISGECIARIDARKPWPIPEQGDLAFLNKWLLWVRGVRSSCS